MKREELLIKLQEIFADIFDNDEIKIDEHTNANDIEEWDSFSNISILAAIQDEFSVTFEINEVVSMKNVGNMLDAILKKMK